MEKIPEDIEFDGPKKKIKQTSNPTKNENKPITESWFEQVKPGSDSVPIGLYGVYFIINICLYQFQVINDGLFSLISIIPILLLITLKVFLKHHVISWALAYVVVVITMIVVHMYHNEF